jgi:hypothetical protein
MSHGEHSVMVARTIGAPLDIHLPRRPEPICHRPSVRVCFEQDRTTYIACIVRMSDLLNEFRDRVSGGFVFDSRFRIRKDRPAKKIMK